MTGESRASQSRTRWVECVGLAAVLMVAPFAWAHSQSAAASAHAAHSAPRSQSLPAPRAASKPPVLGVHPKAPTTVGGGATQRYGTGYAGAVGNAGANGQTAPGSRPLYPGPPSLGPGYSRPVVPGHIPPADLPAGHLGAWLNEHRDLPVQEQERILRGDPSFHRLNPADQQRLVNQLHRVYELTPEERQRRLARTENLEHLPVQERMQVERSFRLWPTLPADRQVLLKNAFRDLRGVPLDQRAIVLNSNRYQGVFSPQERRILSDFLRVEPYEPAR